MVRGHEKSRKDRHGSFTNCTARTEGQGIRGGVLPAYGGMFARSIERIYRPARFHLRGGEG
jgi:hypothetical protein